MCAAVSFCAEPSPLSGWLHQPTFSADVGGRLWALPFWFPVPSWRYCPNTLPSGRILPGIPRFCALSQWNLLCSGAPEHVRHVYQLSGWLLLPSHGHGKVAYNLFFSFCSSCDDVLRFLFDWFRGRRVEPLPVPLNGYPCVGKSVSVGCLSSCLYSSAYERGEGGGLNFVWARIIVLGGVHKEVNISFVCICQVLCPVLLGGGPDK